MSNAQTSQEILPKIATSQPDHAQFETTDAGLLARIQRFFHSYPTTVPLVVLILSLIGFGIVAGDRFFPPTTCR